MYASLVPKSRLAILRLGTNTTRPVAAMAMINLSKNVQTIANLSNLQKRGMTTKFSPSTIDTTSAASVNTMANAINAETSATAITIDTLKIPNVQVLTSLSALREWRANARAQGIEVGFVPTMGALHEGHLNLVKHSLSHNPLTVVSIFVNPAQFAPHEDLATYPRTLPRDLELLEELVSASTPEESSPMPKLAVFVPSVKDMYPTGITQEVAEQRGTFVQVKGFEEEMEGRSRPGFFRGVATVVIKLFNAVEPTHAYFGQKDIQQALLLRRLCSDLLLSHPLPERLHIVKTTRSVQTGLALSSRNAYLSDKEKAYAPTLQRALLKGVEAFQKALGEAIQGEIEDAGKRRPEQMEKIIKETVEAAQHSGASSEEDVRKLWETIAEKVSKEVEEDAVALSAGLIYLDMGGEVRETAEKVVSEAIEQAKKDGVEMKLDYISLNWSDTFKPVEDILGDDLVLEGEMSEEGINIEARTEKAIILSGAIWVGRTRLIDNLILGKLDGLED